MHSNTQHSLGGFGLQRGPLNVRLSVVVGVVGDHQDAVDVRHEHANRCGKDILE